MLSDKVTIWNEHLIYGKYFLYELFEVNYCEKILETYLEYLSEPYIEYS